MENKAVCKQLLLINVQLQTARQAAVWMYIHMRIKMGINQKHDYFNL